MNSNTGRLNYNHFTRKTLLLHIDGFLASLTSLNVKLGKVWLYGSYSRGNVHKFSDIDLAIWVDQHDLETVEKPETQSIIRAYYPIHVKWYVTERLEEDPFIHEIITTGQEIVVSHRPGAWDT